MGTHIGGGSPFIFQVPTKIFTSRFGRIRFSSEMPRSVLVQATFVPCAMLLARARSAGIR